MAPEKKSKPTGKRAVKFSTMPGKGEVKVSVLNIRGPYSADIIRPDNMPTTSVMPVRRPQSSVSCVTAHSASKPVSSNTQPQTPTTAIQSCLNKDSVSRRTESSTQHLIGHSPGLHPLCFTGASDSALKECLIIKRLHPQTQEATPDGPAAV